ncbi:MAG: hypothetical protein A2X78_02705 [Gammaproteobacteria bacterium GWE2_37_16]|nr:MAG: hypothetical protein A2X78_02705 [Gammaproteobacteria bacterium GWE2_37_16]
MLLKKTVHIIEPTLQDETGHCCGYVTALLEASATTDLQLELWIGNKAKKLFLNATRKHYFFIRQLRRLQILFLYYYLLKKNAIIFIPTAGQIDLVFLNWLLKKNLPQNNNIFLHFHRYTTSDKKLATLRQIAEKHQEFNILAPTERLLSIFSNAGFGKCHLARCPTHTRPDTKLKASGKMQYLLYAGAARQEKGLHLVVELIQYLHEVKSNIPVVVQISPNHVGNYDEKTGEIVEKLKKCSYPFLKLYEVSLNKAEYLALFEDAICLLLYDVGFYADQFSSVALDAFYAGCPILTTNGTWISDMVDRFQAGAIVDNAQPDSLYKEIEKISSSFQKLQQNTVHAGDELRKEHDPHNTLAIISQGVKLNKLLP